MRVVTFHRTDEGFGRRRPEDSQTQGVEHMRTKGIKRNRRRGGFTLLEILVVVGIIALLAAFVVPNFINVGAAQEKKLAEAAVANSGPISSAIDTFRMDLGRYPESLEELTKKPDDEEEAKKWNGPYLKDAADLKDPWGREYQYKSPGDVNTETYDLWSTGPKGDDESEYITNYKKE